MRYGRVLGGLEIFAGGAEQFLRRLEREVGQPLMRRHARGMAPTDAGEVLVRHARKVLRQLAAAEADLREVAGLRSGRLVLGTFPTIASSFLPLVVRRFRLLHPEIRLDVLSGREPQLVEWLENGTVGLSLLWDYAFRRMDASSELAASAISSLERMELKIRSSRYLFVVSC